MNESSIYEDLQDRNNLKRFMQTQLEDYSETPGLVPMNLVLFQDAIEHGLYATTSTSTVQRRVRRRLLSLEHSCCSHALHVRAYNRGLCPLNNNYLGKMWM